jgi:hypothetical protein
LLHGSEGEVYAISVTTLPAGALAACIFLSAAAHAQVRGPGLADNQLLFESIARLNAAEPTQVGHSEAWSNPQTNSSGTSTVLRVFRSGGMACHLAGC